MTAGHTNLSPYDKLPLVGPWISHLGQIHDIFATPCHTDPQVWVKAAFYASPRLLWLPAKPFLLATQWHMRTGRSHRGLKGIAKIGAEFAPKNPLGGKPGWAFFQGMADIILKAEWYFMIADRTLEFLVNWSSLAYEMQGCKFPKEYWIEGKITEGLVITSTSEHLVGPFQCDDYQGHHTETGLMGIPTGFSGYVKHSISLSPREFLGIPKMESCRVDVRDVLDNQTLSSSRSGQDEHGNIGNADANFYETFNNPPQLFGMFIEGALGAADVNEITMGVYAHKTGDKGLLFDP